MSNDAYLLLKRKKNAVAKKLTPGAEPSGLPDRIVFETSTDNGKCGGTDAFIYLQLETPDGKIYPAKDDWYVLNNPGDDMECGSSDIYTLEKEEIQFCSKMRLRFIRNGDNPEWDFDSVSLVKWRWYSTQNRWRPVDVINNWRINECLKKNDIYEYESAGPTHPLPNKQEEYNAGIDHLRNNHDSFNKSLAALEETLGISQVMSLKSKLIHRTPLAKSISNSDIPNPDKMNLKSLKD